MKRKKKVEPFPKKIWREKIGHFANVERQTFKNERLSKIFRGKHNVKFIGYFLGKTNKLVERITMF